jgi:hypothetical protein
MASQQPSAMMLQHQSHGVSGKLRHDFRGSQVIILRVPPMRSEELETGIYDV